MSSAGAASARPGHGRRVQRLPGALLPMSLGPMLGRMLGRMPALLLGLALAQAVSAQGVRAQPEADGRVEDLLDIYAQARAADPTLAAADARRGVQHAAVLQARAQLLPQWQLAASDSSGSAGGGAAAAWSLSSRLSQVLFDLGRLRGWQAEATLAAAQEAQLRAAEQALCARVARAYFGVLSAQAALATAVRHEDTLAQQARQAQSRFEAGLAAQVDAEQGRAVHALARGSTLQARLALADARAALTQITGRTPGALRPLLGDLPAGLAAALPAARLAAPATEPPTEPLADPLAERPTVPPAAWPAPSAPSAPPASPAPPPQPQPPGQEAWVEQALQANPALLALALGVEASRQRIAAAAAAHGPTLSAGIDSQRLGGAGVAEHERGRSQTQLTLRLNLPLSTGGATHSQVRQASLQRDALQQELEAARRALARETRAQHQALLAGAELLHSTQAAVQAAERALASTRAGQALGTRTMGELLQAIQTQATARSAHDQARHGQVLAQLLLQQAAGSLGVLELEAVNRLLTGPPGQPDMPAAPAQPAEPAPPVPPAGAAPAAPSAAAAAAAAAVPTVPSAPAAAAQAAAPAPPHHPAAPGAHDAAVLP